MEAEVVMLESLIAKIFVLNPKYKKVGKSNMKTVCTTISFLSSSIQHFLLNKRWSKDESYNQTFAAT